MFDFLKKKHEIFPEAIIASDWWASKLLEPTIKYYNGNMCLSIQKESIPSKESVALFKSNLTQIINNCLERSLNSYPYNLCISSSDNELISLAKKANIDDFESHFGKGALMFIDYDNVSVLETCKKCIKIRK